MNKQDKYRAASLLNFSQAELDKARENLAFVKRRFPEESAKEQAVIAEKGLGDHREVISHYSRFRVPMTSHELSVLQLFEGSSYSGSFAKGEQRDAPTHRPAGEGSMLGSSAADLLYRPAIKPDGA